VLTAGSVGDRVSEVLELSRFRARTVEPCAEPSTGFRRVVVLERVTPLRERTESEARMLGRRSGEEVGEGSFVVVKKLKTLSATMLILALARLWVLLRWGGGPVVAGVVVAAVVVVVVVVGGRTGSMVGMVVERVRATRISCGGVLDWRIWPSTF